MLQTVSTDTLKKVKLSELKSAGDKALKNIARLGKKRVKVAGVSVNPFIVGGAALLLVGGYLLLRKRKNTVSMAAEPAMGA